LQQPPRALIRNDPLVHQNQSESTEQNTAEFKFQQQRKIIEKQMEEIINEMNETKQQQQNQNQNQNQTNRQQQYQQNNQLQNQNQHLNITEQISNISIPLLIMSSTI